MYRKLGGIGLALVSLVPIGSAQISGSRGFQGILPLISNILGIDVGSPFVLLGTAATFGVMVLVNYIILKKAFARMDMLDIVNVTGHDGGRNILAILSVLMTLSIIGTGAFTGIIQGFQGIVILLMLFLVVGGLFVVSAGGIGGVVGGGAIAAGEGTRAIAKGAEKTSEGLQEASEAFGSARQNIRGAEQDAEEGNIQEAEQEFERVVELLEVVESDLGEGFESQAQELEDAHKKLINVEKAERRFTGKGHNRFEDLDERLKRTRQFLEGVIRGKGNFDELIFAPSGDLEIKTTSKGGDYDDNRINQLRTGPYTHNLNTTSFVDVSIPADYNLQTLEEDVQKIEKDIKIIQREYDNEHGEFVDAVKEFEDAVDKAIRTHSLLESKMIPLLRDLEEDSEEMEKIESKRKLDQLHDATAGAIREEKKIEDIADKLEEYSENIKNKVEEVLNEVEDIMEYDEGAVQNLKQALQWSSSLESEVGDLITACDNTMNEMQSNGNDGTTLYNQIGELMQDIHGLSSQINTIENQLDQIESELDKEEKDVAGEMTHMFDNVDPGSEKEEIAMEVGNDIRNWIGKSRFSQKRV
jgi:hypothetical protein